MVLEAVVSGIDRHPDRTEIYFRLQIESSSLVSVLFIEVFSHPYISFFHLLSPRHNEPNPVCWTTRTPPLYGRTRLYGFMALNNEISHYFHSITTSTHILGTPPLSPRHNEPNPVRSTTGHTSYMDGQDSTALWL